MYYTCSTNISYIRNKSIKKYIFEEKKNIGGMGDFEKCGELNEFNKK